MVGKRWKTDVFGAPKFLILYTHGNKLYNIDSLYICFKRWNKTIQKSYDFQLDHVGFLYCSVVMLAAVFFSWPTYADCVDDFFWRGQKHHTVCI